MTTEIFNFSQFVQVKEIGDIFDGRRGVVIDPYLPLGLVKVLVEDEGYAEFRAIDLVSIRAND